MNYGRTRIGDRDVMLPETAELRVLQSSGEESLTCWHSRIAAHTVREQHQLRTRRPAAGDGGTRKPRAAAAVALPPVFRSP